MQYLQRDIIGAVQPNAPAHAPTQRQPVSPATPAIIQTNRKFMYTYNYKDLIEDGKSISLRLSNINNGTHFGRVTFSLDDNNNIFAEVYYGGKTTFYTDLNDLRLLIGLLSTDNLDVKTTANTSLNSGTSFANKLKTFMPGGRNYNIDAVHKAYNGQLIPIIAALNELSSPRRDTAAPQQISEPTQPAIEKPPEQPASRPQSNVTPTMTLQEARNLQALKDIKNDSRKFIEDLYAAQDNFPDGSTIIPVSLKEYNNSRDTFGEWLGENLVNAATFGIRDKLLNERIEADIARSKLPSNEYYDIREDNSILKQLDQPIKDLVRVAIFEQKVLSRSIFQSVINPLQKPSRPGTILSTGVTRESLDTFTDMVNALSEATPELREQKNRYLEKIELYEFNFFVENVYDRNPTLENTELFIAKIQELPLKLPNRNIHEFQNSNYRKIYNKLIAYNPLTAEVRRIGSKMPDPFGKPFRT
jgi:hypothetical protein